MYLFQDKKLFADIVGRTAVFFDMSEEIIEKDYFVSLVLKELVAVEPDIVFKGGTSLSKAYQLINRFSEDIDLSYYSEDHHKIGTSRRKKLTKSIKKILMDKNLSIVNLEEIKSGYMVNKFEVDYGALYNGGTVLRPTLLIETYYQFVSFPVSLIQVDNYISQMAKKVGAIELFSDFEELVPFDMKVQTLERTFVDKIFAVCDCYIGGRSERSSRHLYDLVFLFRKGELDSALLCEVFIEVRELLQQDLLRNPSSRSNVDISFMLRELLTKDFFKQDYINNTTLLVRDAPSYEEIKQELLLMVDELRL